MVLSFVCENFKAFSSRAGRRAGPSDAEVTSRGSLGGMSMLLTRTHCAIVCCSAPMLKPFVYMGGVRSSSSECLWRETVRADDTARIAVSFFRIRRDDRLCVLLRVRRAQHVNPTC